MKPLLRTMAKVGVAQSYLYVIVVLIGNLAASVTLYEGVAIFLKEIPVVRSVFSTGSRPSPSIEALINSHFGWEKPIVIEANAELPLRDSPPKAEGLSPLRKGNKISEIAPNSEWVILDTVKFKKLTGDDTWVRVASRDDISKVWSEAKLNTDELRRLLDKPSDSQKAMIRNGWAYLGNNFSPDR
jgi:hypothetical protein